MAGEYGEIHSRVDYERILGEATELVKGFLTKSPDYEVMQRIARELEAMKRWSEGGREPTEGERESIDIGLLAVREFADGPEELAELSEKLFELNNYFEDWPTDEEAASRTKEDSWEEK